MSSRNAARRLNQLNRIKMYELSVSIAPTYGILIGAAGSIAVVIVSAILSTIQFKQNV